MSKQLTSIKSKIGAILANLQSNASYVRDKQTLTALISLFAKENIENQSLISQLTTERVPISKINTVSSFYLRFNPVHSCLSICSSHSKMLDTLTEMFKDNPAFPLKIKVFLALTAVSAVNCLPLASVLEIYFLSIGGESKWLSGDIPPKLDQIKRLNAILAFKPWKVKQPQLKELLLFWNLNELVSVVFILSYFHREALFYQAFNFRKEVEPTKTEPEEAEECSSPVFSVKSLKSKQLQEFANFNEKGEEFLNKMDFNWEDHASYILSQYDSALTEHFSREFEVVFGEEDLERSLISGYIEFIMGYYDDEANYALINKVFSKYHKKFFKMIATEPQRIEAVEAASVLRKYGETSIELVTLVLTAKLRLEVVYFASALNGIRLA